jgi:hypothetical protein
MTNGNIPNGYRMLENEMPSSPLSLQGLNTTLKII